MPDPIPTATELAETLRRTLACVDAYCRRAHPGRRFEGEEYLAACEAEDAAMSRLESFFGECGGKALYGWPEGVSATLREISLMLRLGGGYVDSRPGGMPAFREEIESLAARLRAGEAAPDPPAPEAYEKVPSARALERRYLDGVHNKLEATARALEDLKVIRRSQIRPGKGNRKELWVVWLRKPEGLGRRRRKREGPPS
jgi:hypothetical protein